MPSTRKVPFLVKYAKRLPDKETESDSPKRTPHPGTLSTKVDRETTDDQ